MKKNNVAIVLGGTFPHRELIQKLKNRGYYTLLIDYYENPIAKSAADEHIRESTLAKDKVLEIAKKKQAEIVISTCIDQANVTACYVAEKLNLPKPYSYDIAVNVTNKVLMKKIMCNNFIPTSKYYHINKISDFNAAALSFPIIVKPTDSNSSKGVRKIYADEKNIINYVEKSLALSRTGEAIIEEFKEGKEIGIDCIIKDSTAHIIMTRERRKIRSNSDAIQQIYGSFWPADITAETFEKLSIIAQKIAESFHLDNTPLMMQTIVNNNTINVIEFAPRIGGAENYRIIKMLTGYDIIDAAIDSFFNHPIKLNLNQYNGYVSDNYIYAKPKYFGNLVINDSVKSIIEYYNVYKNKGTEIGEEISSNNRIGVFTVKSDTIEGLNEKINLVLKNIEVYDIDGNPIMRKDIY
jgi:biotin carboxylase